MIKGILLAAAKRAAAVAIATGVHILNALQHQHRINQRVLKHADGGYCITSIIQAVFINQLII